MNEARPARARLHYAWVVVAAGAIVATVASSLRYSFGVFLDALVELRAWDRGAISLAYAIQFLVFGVASIWAGSLSEKYGTRKLLVAGGVLFVVSLAGLGTVTSIWQLYLYYGILLGIALTPFYSPLHTSITGWFKKNLGVALGTVVASQGLGSVVIAPLFRLMLSTLGWGRSFVATGVVGGSLLLFAASIFRNRPSDMGIQAYGVTAQDNPSAVQTGKDHRGSVAAGALSATLGEAAATRAFWLLITVHLLGCVSHSIPLVHVVAMATDVGIDRLVAASVLGFLSGFSVISRFGMSVLADVIGGKRALAFTMMVQATSILILLFATEVWHFYLFSFFFGVGYGGEMVIFPILNRDYYTGWPIASIYGYQLFGAGVGMAIGSYLGGVLFDLTGSYTSAIWVAVLTGYGSVVAALSLTPPVRKAAQAASEPA